MIKDKIDTKKLILDVSLELFSKRGYSSVSIRDICGKVGIKESTIYYHFANKQDIFDCLCKSFTDTTYALPKEFAEQASKVKTVKEEEFLMVCQSFLNGYLMDEKINKFIRMLIIEQSTNPQAAALYHKVLFDDALEGQKVIFGWLVSIGFLKDSDVDSMVFEYYASVVYLFHRYLVVGEITEDIKKQVNQLLVKHVQSFLARYHS